MLEQRLAIVRWAAGLGAITAESLAHRDEISVAAARGRLGAAVARRLLSAEKPLREGSTLYSATPSGLKAIACRLDGCRVGPSNARHLIACAAVAAELERCYPDHVVSGERELRYEEREHGRRLASAVLGTGQMGRPLLHRPDLVIWAARSRLGFAAGGGRGRADAQGSAAPGGHMQGMGSLPSRGRRSVSRRP